MCYCFVYTRILIPKLKQAEEQKVIHTQGELRAVSSHLIQLQDEYDESQASPSAFVCYSPGCISKRSLPPALCVITEIIQHQRNFAETATAQGQNGGDA